MEKGGRIIEKSSGFPSGLYSLFLICILLPVVGGCLYREDAGIAVPEGNVVFDRIAVIPFQQIVPEEAHSGTVRCPLCGLMVDATRSSGSQIRSSRLLLGVQFRGCGCLLRRDGRG